MVSRQDGTSGAGDLDSGATSRVQSAFSPYRDDVESGEVWPDDDDEKFEVWEDDGFPSVDLIHYVMDLEDLIRWFALMFSYRVYDTETGEESIEINDPIWTVYDERGNHLPAADKLQSTWRRVMHDG
jgi:hypothetical protein